MYTMRGKYKQIFLRLTPESYECASSNLVVTPDRTVELYIDDVSLCDIASVFMLTTGGTFAATPRR